MIVYLVTPTNSSYVQVRERSNRAIDHFLYLREWVTVYDRYVCSFRDSAIVFSISTKYKERKIEKNHVTHSCTDFPFAVSRIRRGYSYLPQRARACFSTNILPCYQLMLYHLRSKCVFSFITVAPAVR